MRFGVVRQTTCPVLGLVLEVTVGHELVLGLERPVRAARAISTMRLPLDRIDVLHALEVRELQFDVRRARFSISAPLNTCITWRNSTFPMKRTLSSFSAMRPARIFVSGIPV